MKLKFWQSEFEFDKDDAKIVIPLILLLLGLRFTPIPKGWLLLAGAFYFLLFFFIPQLIPSVRKLLERLHIWRVYRCPYCKSHELIFLGMQDFRGDIPYDWYRCNLCCEDSVYANNINKMVKTNH